MANYEVINGVCVIPEGTVSLCEGDITDRLELKELILPDSLIYIQNNALKGCTNLKYITLPATAEKTFYYVAPRGLCRIEDAHPYKLLFSVLVNGGFCVHLREDDSDRWHHWD